MRQLLTTIAAGVTIGAAVVAVIAILWHTGQRTAALTTACAATTGLIIASITAARGHRRRPVITTAAMPRLAIAASAIAVVSVTTITAALLGQPAQPTAATIYPSNVDAYIQALNTITGWAPQNPEQQADELATGHTICQMLATGWNEAGVVANMLTWGNNDLTQAQLAAAVHLTRLRLCGQGA